MQEVLGSFHCHLFYIIHYLRILRFEKVAGSGIEPEAENFLRFEKMAGPGFEPENLKIFKFIYFMKTMKLFSIVI